MQYSLIPYIAEVSLNFPIWQDQKRNLCQAVFTNHHHSSAPVQKCGQGKYQNHLANDGVNSHKLDRNTNTTLQRLNFPLWREKRKETSAKQGNSLIEDCPNTKGFGCSAFPLSSINMMQFVVSDKL